MNIVDIELRVEGDSYQEILDSARRSLSKFFDIDIDTVDKNLSYRIEVEENPEMDSDSDFTGKVTARWAKVS